MANIALTFQSPIKIKNNYCMPVFYDGLASALKSHGHNVLCLITSSFLKAPLAGSNRIHSNSLHEKIISKVDVFKPDLIISFNNSSIESIERKVSCPIALWNADDIIFFNNINEVKKSIERYHFMSFTDEGIKRYKDTLSAPENRIAKVQSATTIKRKAEKKEYDLSFIGTPFFVRENLIQFFKENPKYLDDIDGEAHNNELNNKTLSKLNKNDIPREELLYFRSGPKRIASIISLLTLKCKVFGPQEWLNLAPIAPDIIGHYAHEPVYSLLHNELIYNRSKVSINIRHSQNKEGYPWRVVDILASDSVLLSDPSRELFKDFNLPKDQIFSSPSEAYYASKKLLNNATLREDLVSRQNEIIEKNFRWHHRFPIIQQLTGVNLEKNPGQPGTYEIFQPNIKLKSP